MSESSSNNNSSNLSQKDTPFFTAMLDYLKSDPTPFDVPGHKMGNFRTELSQVAGDMIYKLDINAPIGLDNLYHASGVIRQAETLFSEVFRSDKCLFSVNGTSGGILTMIVGLVGLNEKIILPRNVHKSVINAIILSGAIPIFVSPNFDQENGIANGVPFENYKTAIDNNPDAKAVFVINPTYFGVCSDIKNITEYAHYKGMIVMADEAHGSHLYFSDNLPISAMDAGCDISSLSIHKTAGSLTQSSVILINHNANIDFSKVRKAFSMFSSTSPNHLLIASLDVARKKLYFQGKDLVEKAIQLAKYGRTKLNQIKGIRVLEKSHYCNKDGRYDFDSTKLVIKVNNLGLSGFEVYRIMREEFNIQLELAEVGIVLAIVTIGSKKEDIDNLVEAFKILSERFYAIRKTKSIPKFRYMYPKSFCSPFVAFHAPTKLVLLEDSVGEVVAESLMIYPPGIPLAIPGEYITKQAYELIEFYLTQGGVLLSDSPNNYVRVLDKNAISKSKKIKKVKQNPPNNTQTNSN